MSRIPQQVSTTGTRALAAVLLNTIVLKYGMTGGSHWYWALPLTLPLLGVALAELAREQKPR